MTGSFVKRVLGIGGAFLLLVSVGLSAQIPAGPLHLDPGLAPGESLHGATAPKVEVQAEVLATLELSNGSTVTFLAVPEIGDLGYSELVPPGAHPVLPHDNDLRALDIFLALAPLDVLLPRALVEFDTRKGVERLVVGRELTDRLSEPVYILLDALDFEEGSLRNQVGASHYCDSSTEFAGDRCKASAGHNCGLIDFCDAGLWVSLTRSSYRSGWQEREASYGYTSACGTDVRIEQQWWTGGAWSTLSTQVAPDGFNYISSWHGPNAFRRIVRVRQSASGGFRAYTNFHNDC